MAEQLSVVPAAAHPQSTEVWANARRKGIGGTDISAILGINPWKSSFDVWLDKTGQAPPFIPNERAYWGKRLELIIAEEYAARTSRPVRWVDDPMIGKGSPIQIWTPDALCRNEERGLDCKTAGFDQGDKWGEAGTDQIPDHNALQAQWYMSASGFPVWDVALLLGGNDFRIYTLYADEALHAEMLNAAEDWWNRHVVAGEPPEIGATPGCSEYLKSRFPRNSGTIRPATKEERALLLQYAEARARYDEAEANKDAIENQLKLQVADDDGVQFPGCKFTWKKSKDGQHIDWEAIAREVGASDEVIAAHTTAKPGSRRIYFALKGAK